MILRRDGSLPAFLHDDGLMRLDDNRRRRHLMAGQQLPAQKNAGFKPPAARKKSRVSLGGGKGSLRYRQQRLGKFGTAADCLHRDRLNDQLLAVIDKSKTRFVGGFKRRFHLLKRRNGG